MSTIDSKALKEVTYKGRARVPTPKISRPVPQE